MGAQLVTTDPESTQAGVCGFFRTQIRSQKFLKNRARSHLLLSAVAGLSVVIINDIA